MSSFKFQYFNRLFVLVSLIALSIFVQAQLLPQYNSNSLAPTINNWQGYSFNSIDWSNETNKEKFEQLFVNYLTLLRGSSGEVIIANFETFVDISHHNEASLAFFYGQFDKFLNNPNSPLRSEYFYEAVLLKLKASTKLSKGYVSKINSQLKVVNMNRPGSIAANFEYTTVNKQKGSLHAIKASYVLLHFSNSGCHACAEIFEGIKKSQVIASQLASGQLTIITVDISKDNNKLIPNNDNWILALDPDEEIEGRGLYNLPAMPSLYLLDKDKKVLIKDGALPYIESYLVNGR